MTTETNTRAALDARLASMPDCPEVDWENVGLEQPNGVYLSVAMVTAEDIAVGIERGGTDVAAGLYQITVSIPKGTGKKPFTDVYANIKSHFPRGLRMVQDGTAVIIHKVFAAPALSDDTHFRIPVSIRYRAV